MSKKPLFFAISTQVRQSARRKDYMNIPRIVLNMTLVAIALNTATAAEAQSFPERPVRFVIGLTVGSSSDIAMRIIGKELTKSWGQNAVIDNRPGAGGNIAAELVSNAEPDGYTLLFWNVGIAISHAVYRNLRYNALTDLVPVSLATSMPQVACVTPASSVHSIKDLIALAKARPGGVLFSSAGTGQADHMAGELFGYMAGVKMTHVPYKGGPQALAAVMSGEVLLDFPGLAVALPHVTAGKVRALAVTSEKRSAALPSIPTIAESGVPGYQQTIWSGAFAPRRVARSVVAKLSDDFARALKAAEVQERLAQLGVEPVGSTSSQFEAFFKADVAKWIKVAKATGIQAD